MNIKELCELLKERVGLCEFTLSEDEKVISFKLFSLKESHVIFTSEKYDGTIQLANRNNEDETIYFVLSSFAKNANMYFIHPADITDFLDSEINEKRKYFSGLFEAYFRIYTKSFSQSFKVVNEKETVFTNIAVLKHKDNAWYKWFYGGNRFEKVFVSGFYLNNELLYCVSLYNGETADCACCSTSFIEDLPVALNAVLKTLRNFEFMKKTS